MFKKVSDIIELIVDYHEGLSAYFLSLKPETDDERLVLLLEYLGKNELFMAEYLDKYKHTMPGRIKNSWVKFVPQLPTDIFCECKKNLFLQPPLSTFNVLDAALHFDDCLVSFYSTLSQQIQDEQVAEVFFNLLRVTKKHEMNLSRDISWLHDL